MNKCTGCGSVLQSENPNQEGFQPIKDNTLCQRCFRIQHYNEYQRVIKENSEFIQNLEEIKQSNDLVVLVIDLMNISQNIKEIAKYCSKNLILAFTKRDLLPLSIPDQKLKDYQKIIGIESIETIVISAVKNKGLDELYQAIENHKSSKYVYIVGYTNAGKSTLINHMIMHYSNIKRTITTSMLSSTTLGNIEIPLHDNLILLDTPGILEKGNICEKVELSSLKKILPKKEIKPITYQIKTKQSILIDQVARIDSQNNNLTLYFSNQLKIERIFVNKPTLLYPYTIHVEVGEDIVILGLGFIKVGKSEDITIYTLKDVSVFKRKSLI